MSVPEPMRHIPIRDGIMFLGFEYRLTETGKVIMSIDPTRVKTIRRKLYRMVKKAKAGLLTRAKVDESYQSWRSHAAKGNSWKLLKRMDTYYNSLWRCETCV